MSDEPRPKKMRKGTRSCMECRRRKKTCVPHPDSPNTCTECFARATTCRPQQPVETLDRSGHESRQSLQRRVAELENALHSISRKLDITDTANQLGQSATKTNVQPRPNTSPPTPASLVTSLPDSYVDNAPVLSLFDNDILSRRQDDNDFGTTTAGTPPLSTSATSARAMKLENARQTLLSLFPSQVTLEAILGAANLWWPTWQHMFSETFGAISDYTFDQFIENTKSSDNALKLAKALISISICLQEVSFSTNCKASTATGMANRYIGMIDELVLSDDELAGTLDGIECLILQAKYNSNNGRLRRAWLGFRRGISFAQLLGCHLRSTQLDQSAEQNFRRKSIWNALYLGDRYISLLLGLPYCVSETLVHPTDFNGLYPPVNDGTECAGSDYLLRLARLVGYIIDRNQTTTPTESLTMTVKIEGELIDLAATMPNTWWALDMQENEVSSSLYNRILPQFWHHQARALLHLPFMLKATIDRRYGYNKIAALESARAMLNLFHIFRPVQGFGSPVCKLMDFQAFTVAMILVLNFLSVSSSSPDNEVREADEDRKLVSTTTSTLQHASVGAGGVVATQAARALEMFIGARDHGSIDSQATCKLVIPYFGTVCIGPGTSYANKSHLGTPATQPQPQVPTPEEEPLVYMNPGQTAGVGSAPIHSESNYAGFLLQQTQSLATDSNAIPTANLDLDGDWSWFWDNTEFPYGEMQSLAELPSLN